MRIGARSGGMAMGYRDYVGDKMKENCDVA